MDIDNSKQIITIINTVLVNNGKSPVESIPLDADLRAQLGFDSFDLAELTVRIQAQFDVDVFEGSGVATLRQILQKIGK